ncbi:hypothetical protein GCM10010261_01790 [Streptomyces pilosus]|uniref:Uncharacterized protein n=1 Tax=Streptomyces pilosus TaxID=28893 RepID=A0A918BFJ5_9ACTN|nr:hypothetical protein GCM10010280_09930 [Streptomyces pilosus]GGV33663.1 hypothetical protein GCM10010261_01790 [Streptomyces pilosus]
MAGAARAARGPAAVTGARRPPTRRSGRVGARPAAGEPGAAPGRTAPGRNRTAGRPGTGWRGYTGRVTGFRARRRIFSANFRLVYASCGDHPPSLVRPAQKGSREPRAPYGDWPPRQGALPCTPRECNPS